MKIGVFGIGYVGLANAVLLAQNNEVVAYDISVEKVSILNERKSPIQDREIEEFLQHVTNLRAAKKAEEAYRKADVILIATPTNYDVDTNSFDTSSIENVIKKGLELNRNALYLIKSTIPIGYVESIRKKFQYENIVFSPEFLREGHALYDNLYPSRIVVGDRTEKGGYIARMFAECAKKKDIEIVLTGCKEAEAIKLFANTYLAIRVAYFNELDTFAMEKGLRCEEILKGVCLDQRIGNFYNNPSFGYGGYCLPKDTQELKVNYKGVEEALVSAVVEANHIRKRYIVKKILEKEAQTVGIYRLTMKAGSDNFRSAAMWDVIDGLKKGGKEIIIYEPNLTEEISEFVESDLEKFKRRADVIVANRVDDHLKDVREKVFSRDIYLRD